MSAPPQVPQGEPPTPVPDPGAPRDPAASMSLLTQLLHNPLDAGYHAYAEETRHQHVPTWRRIAVVVLAFLLGLASAVAVLNLRTPRRDDVEAGLLDQVEGRQQVVLDLESDVSGLSAQIRAMTDAVAQPTSAADTGLDLATAGTEVTGPGVSVTLSDAPTGSGATTPDMVVRDQDIRVVVNALWSAGAEAVAVNGLRLGPGTFIRTAGSTILVNVTALKSPYEVEAIGDANALQVALVRGGTGDYLSAAKSVRSIGVGSSADKSLTLEGLDSSTTRYATPVDNSSGG